MLRDVGTCWSARSVVGGWVGIPALLTGGRDINVFHHWLSPVVGAAHGVTQGEAHAASTEGLLMAAALAVLPFTTGSRPV